MFNALKILIITLGISAFASPVMLLKTYTGKEDLKGWVMSEKLDGVRALWDGKTLKSRSGAKYIAPLSFIRCFPNFALDGELYSKRDDFENIASITSKLEPHEGWDELKYYIFDLPNYEGDLNTKLEFLQNYLDKNPCENIKIIEQISIKDKNQVEEFFKRVTDNHGEGIVLRDPKAKYIDGRSDSILKYKKFQDAECEVLGYKPGKGKYEGLMGSLSCKDLKSSVIFSIGSGFKDKDRENPPKIGSIITYKYQGLTKNNKPRFPVFLRIRNER